MWINIASNCFVENFSDFATIVDKSVENFMDYFQELIGNPNFLMI